MHFLSALSPLRGSAANVTLRSLSPFISSCIAFDPIKSASDERERSVFAHLLGET
jgi:hypothetical protein